MQMQDILCNECFNKLLSLDDFEFCCECREKISRFCFNCDTLQDEPIDYVCESCKESLLDFPRPYILS